MALAEAEAARRSLTTGFHAGCRESHRERSLGGLGFTNDLIANRLGGSLAPSEHWNAAYAATAASPSSVTSSSAPGASCFSFANLAYGYYERRP